MPSPFTLSKINLSQRVLFLVGVPLCFQFIFVGVLYFLLAKAQHEADLLARSRAVVAACDEERSAGMRMALAAYNFNLSKSEHAKKILEQRIEHCKQSAAKLKSLVMHDPAQLQQFENLQKSESKNIKAMLAATSMISEGDEQESLKFTEISILSFGAIKDLAKSDYCLQEIVRIEKAKGIEPAHEQYYRHLVTLCLTVGLFINAGLVLFLTAIFNRDVMTRLGVLLDNTRRLSMEQALNPRVKGNDEIARLDKIFHEMANALSMAIRAQRAIVDKALDVICTLDENNKFSMVNPACKQVWGFETDELIGQRIIKILEPSDIDATLNAIEGLKAGTFQDAFENQIKTKSGDTVICRWTAQWSAPEKMLFCVAHDVTDRRKAERRVRALLEEMPVGLLVTDATGKVMSANPRAEEMFGVDESILNGTNFVDYVQDTQGKSSSMQFEAFKEETLGRVKEFSIKTNAQTALPVDMSTSKLRTDEGDTFIISLQDVTERHQLERMKSQFVAMITHDLRTPLAAIQTTLGNAEQGVYGDLTEQGKKRITTAEANCERLIDLISDLLDFEKAKDGKLEIELQHQELNPLIDQAFSAVQGFADASKVKLVKGVCEGTVDVDGRRLVQVLVNLLSNAIKFSKNEGEVRVDVRVLDTFCEISVQDNGRGIPATHLKTIFDQFSQVRPTDEVERRGTGLGLAICKQIIDSHPGGEIGVESEEEKGSRFFIKLPLIATSHKLKINTMAKVPVKSESNVKSE